MQIRERSRWARRTGSDGEGSYDHVQNTARGVVSRAPSRRSSKRRSAHESLKNTQVEDAVEVEVIKVEGICSDIASLTPQRTVRLEFDNRQRREREGDTRIQ